MSNIMTKKDIEEIAFHIYQEIKKCGYDSDVRIYFNNKCIDVGSLKYNPVTDDYESPVKIIEDIDPHNYFKWAAYNHIISMSFEGPLYDYMDYNCELPGDLPEYLEKKGIYFELGQSWNLTFYPNFDNMEIEYTYYKKEEEPEYIYLTCDKKVPEPLKHIMEIWFDLGNYVGDRGCCVIGQKMCFTYKEKKYEMCPMTGWQGSYSWEKWVDTIKKLLEGIGATDIKWDCGILD